MSRPPTTPRVRGTQAGRTRARGQRPQIRSGTKNNANAAGPWGWENWKAMLDGRPPRDALEIACYTDTRIADDTLELRPYTLLGVRGDFDSLYAASDSGASRLGVVLR